MHGLWAKRHSAKPNIRHDLVVCVHIYPCHTVKNVMMQYATHRDIVLLEGIPNDSGIVHFACFQVPISLPQSLSSCSPLSSLLMGHEP
jgi:hypothetical protein